MFSPAGQVPLTLTFMDPRAIPPPARSQPVWTGRSASSEVLSTLGNWQINASTRARPLNRPAAGTLVSHGSRADACQSPHAITIVGARRRNPAAVASGNRRPARPPRLTRWATRCLSLVRFRRGRLLQPGPVRSKSDLHCSAKHRQEQYDGHAELHGHQQHRPDHIGNNHHNADREPSPTAPTVVSVQPANSAGCVDVASDIVIQFDSAMDPQSTQSAVEFAPGLNSPVFTWSTDGKTLTISHADMLA